MLGVAPGPHFPLSLAAEPPKPKRVLRNAVRLLLVPGRGDRRVDSSVLGVLGLEPSAVPGRPVRPRRPCLSPQNTVPAPSYLGISRAFTYIAGCSLGPGAPAHATRLPDLAQGGCSGNPC